MATRSVGVAPMKAAQIPGPEAGFEIVEREIPNQAEDRYASRFRPAVFATVTYLQKKASGREFSIPVFPDMKSPQCDLNSAGTAKNPPPGGPAEEALMNDSHSDALVFPAPPAIRPARRTL